MTLGERRIIAPDIKKAEYTLKGNTRCFNLVAEPIIHDILSDLSIEALGYNGSTPGPLIIVREGEYLSIKLENKTDEPTALHIHGLAKPNSQDGAPDIEPTPLIMPNESYTYKFLVKESGSYFYHSVLDFQSNKGLLGPLIVLPKNTRNIPDRDYIFLLQEWQIHQPELGEVFPGAYRPNKFSLEPNFFTINGKAFPNTAPIYVGYGEKIRFRYINKSNDAHSMHLHGHDFKVMFADGFAQPHIMRDTINIASGTRWEVDFKANNPGIWPMNATKSFHGSNNGKTPGGMISVLEYI